MSQIKPESPCMFPSLLTNFYFIHSAISAGRNPIDELFGNLTNALSRTADFSGKGPGPFGEIDSILNKFDLDFSFVTSLLSQFTEFADMFVAEQALLSQEQNSLISLRPRSLVGNYPALLNLGSKKTSVVYSSELRGLLWDKLVDHFPFSTYLGVQIPGLSIGQTFREKHADR